VKNPVKVRLCTWNIKFGAELSVICDVIKQTSAFHTLDLLALQEASVHNKQTDASTIAKTLGPQFSYYQVGYQRWGDTIQSNAIIWNSDTVQVTKQSSFDLPTREETKLSWVERWILDNYVPAQKRNAVQVCGDIQKHNFSFVSTHLDVGYIHKKVQLQRVLQRIDNDQKRSFLLLLEI
jgi:endonuclease/exonuclease/phosphatase family metal-dependent hydrolase